MYFGNLGLCLLSLVSGINLFGQNYNSYLSGDPNDVQVSVLPAIVLAGGGSDNDDAMKWMLKRAAGGDVVVIRASGSNGYNSYFFSELGVSVNSVETLVFYNKNASYEPSVLEKIKNAEVIFIAGGDQGLYYQYWNATPLGDLLAQIARNKDKVLGGTSAGMMVLGSMLYAPTGTGVISDEALFNPYHFHMSELVFNHFIQIPLLHNMFFDTHFDDRNRTGRLMVFLARAAAEKNIRARAIACNESTAVCIDEKNIATVFGDTPAYPDYAYFLEVNCEDDWKPQTVEAGKPVSWSPAGGNAVISQRLKGNRTGTNRFDLNTWKILVSGDLEHWQIKNGIVSKSGATSAQCKIAVTGLVDGTSCGLTPYPNPSDSILYFEDADVAKLTSMEGVNFDTCNHCSSLDVSKVPKGEYILMIIKGEKKYTYKVSIMTDH